MSVTKKETSLVFRRLQKHFGEINPPLDYDSIEQLAIAVILSAQCTDARVNIVTQKLFKVAHNMKTLNEISEEELRKLIYSTGFYRAKAKNLKKLAAILTDKHEGKIPNDFETLINLPGIGRKTANVIMGLGFKIASGFVVDTHVKRITNLLGWSKKSNPVQIERELVEIIDKKYWIEFPLYIIFLGRKFCKARRRDCQNCVLNDICSSSIVKR